MLPYMWMGTAFTTTYSEVAALAPSASAGIMRHLLHILLQPAHEMVHRKTPLYGKAGARLLLW